MIKSSELRIGNFINDCCMGRCEVRGLTKKGIYITHDGGPSNENAFSPIPLTEEWLIRFNEFGKWPDGSITTGDCEYLFNIEKCLLFKHNEVDGQCSYIHYNPIQYVHQLQNLYFVLTGKELEYTF